MDNEPKQELANSYHAICLRIIKLYQSMPMNGEAQVIGKQVLAEWNVCGSPYREACRAKSRPISSTKMEGSLQELDETAYWLELLVEGRILLADKVTDLQKETNELIAIFVASVKTAKRNK